jgi:hypothetical protein
MKARLRELWFLIALFPLMAVAATFGFWGEQITSTLALPPLPDDSEEAWLAEPIPVVSLAGGFADLAAEDWQAHLAGANPFLTAAEKHDFGGRDGDPSGDASGDLASSERNPWPELHAVVTCDGKDVVLLGSSDGAVEVLEVTGHHVLVKGEEGCKWLHLSAP